jgi:SAM-dependent methyltransferase
VAADNIPSKECFSAFAPYYDLLYRDKDYAGEARFIQEQIESAGVNRDLRSSESILDLGCGTGEHVRQLILMGHRVQGVDASPHMVDIARQKGLMVAHGDVRSYRSSSGVFYDVVVSLFHVASYLTTLADLVAFCDTARCHLRVGGLFIFDCWYGPAVLQHPPLPRARRCLSPAVELVRLAEPTLLADRNEVRIDYLLNVSDRGGQTLTETHTLRYWFLPELRAALQQVGLVVQSVHPPTGEDYTLKIVARCL